MLGVMFVAFIIQIVFRYFLNFPIGWTSELTLILWLWLVLWGAAFVVRESEEIRFDLISASVGRRARIAIGIVAAVALVILYAASLPATPMAMPTSAAASAGASLIPSPTIATKSPFS